MPGSPIPPQPPTDNTEDNKKNGVDTSGYGNDDASIRAANVAAHPSTGILKGSGPDGGLTNQDWANGANTVSKGVTDVWNGINGHYNAPPIGYNQNAGQVGGVNSGQQLQGRDLQSSLIQQLQDQAAGRGPSLAQMQLQKATDANLSNAMALGASQRGAGAAGMQHNIAQQQAGISQQMAGDSGMLALNEQMRARDALGQQVNTQRGQDQAMVEANAQRQAEAAKTQATLDQQRQQMEMKNAHDSSPMGFIGGLFSAMSDENLKTEITPGEGKLYAFLDKLGTHDYRYKDEKHGEGRRISPMAQELVKSDLGKQFVFEHKDGKAVDYGKGLGTMLASQAALHKRLKKLEGK